MPGTIVLMRDAEDMGAEGEEEGVGTGAEAGAVAGTGGTGAGAEAGTGGTARGAGVGAEGVGTEAGATAGTTTGAAATAPTAPSLVTRRQGWSRLGGGGGDASSVRGIL